ncbi:hypothetical protein TcasGA2_TC013026 [Tribolium castaneum]|uniref:Uncharacterized protein n=1 Tax=Tribolium castaneum TaxID=7070 RepID=D6WJP5_TRICA|nr:hypothetical protein TcasGA2_TC013026 [Tribolium castaneum]
MMLDLVSYGSTRRRRQHRPRFVQNRAKLHEISNKNKHTTRTQTAPRTIPPAIIEISRLQNSQQTGISLVLLRVMQSTTRPSVVTV